MFRADGQVFSNGQQYLGLTSLFTQRKSGYFITDVTGWVSPILLYVTTAFDNNTKGPAFWFDVDTKTFLQL